MMTMMKYDETLQEGGLSNFKLNRISLFLHEHKKTKPIVDMYQIVFYGMSAVGIEIIEVFSFKICNCSLSYFLL